MVGPGGRRLALGLAIVAVLGAGVWTVVARTRTHPVSVEDAVARFRTSSSEVPVADDDEELPEPGVYVYATTGREQLDLPGTEHGYPGETTITVTLGGCGWIERWQPLEERWDERSMCADGFPSTYTVHHEFVGQADERTFDCADDVCTDGTVRSARTITSLGADTIDVGGTSVRVTGVRVDEVTTGSTVGEVTSEWWRTPSGLLVRHTTQVATTNETVIGEVDYDEAISLELTSIEPRR